MQRNRKSKAILGFDPGSIGGFGLALVTDTAFVIETKVVPVKTNNKKTRFQYEDLMNNLSEQLEIFYDKYAFDYLFYEQVHRHSAPYAAHKYGAQIGFVQFFCGKRKIKHDGIPVQHAKIALAGFSAATKQHMLLAARRLGYDGDDHNEADAIGIAIAGLRKHFLDANMR